MIIQDADQLKIQLWVEKTFSDSESLVLWHLLNEKEPISPYSLKKTFETEYKRSYHVLHRSFNKIHKLKMTDLIPGPSAKGGTKNLYRLNFFGFCIAITASNPMLGKIGFEDFFKIVKIHSEKDLLLSSLFNDMNLKYEDSSFNLLITILLLHYLGNVASFIGFLNSPNSQKNIFSDGWVPPDEFNLKCDYSMCYNDFFIEAIEKLNISATNDFVVGFVNVYSNHQTLKQFYMTALQSHALKIHVSLKNILNFTPESEIENIIETIKFGLKYNPDETLWIFKATSNPET